MLSTASDAKCTQRTPCKKARANYAEMRATTPGACNVRATTGRKTRHGQRRAWRHGSMVAGRVPTSLPATKTAERARRTH
eukprot:5542610-Alexandrium_andersonii.AAC.1